MGSRFGFIRIIIKHIVLICLLVLSVDVYAEFPPEPLPKNILGSFVPVKPLSGTDKMDYVTMESEKALKYGLNAVNLIVDWISIEPNAQGSVETRDLINLMTVIKSRGMYLVLRIYTNAGSSHQASPDWLLQILPNNEKYNTGGVQNPLPWSITYQNAVRNFLKEFAKQIKAGGVYPDLIQVITGGEYEEQGLWGYTNKPWEYYDQILVAQKKMLQICTEELLLGVEFDVIYESLISAEPDRDNDLVEYGKSLGFKWAQTNAGAKDLASEKWGANTMKIMKSVPGMKYILEDEKGYSQKISVGERLKYTSQVEQEYGIKFNGVILNMQDLIEKESVNIQALRKHLSLPDSICSASVSDAILYVPILKYQGKNFWAYFEIVDSGKIKLKRFGGISNLDIYSECSPATVSDDLTLSIPSVLVNGILYSVVLSIEL